MAVMNKYSNDPLWIKLFGELWDESEKFRGGLGAFILRESDKSVIMDSNAEFLLEHEKNMDFSEFCKAAKANSIAGVEIQCLDTDGDIIAGFVQAEIVCLPDNTVPFIPLLKKNELARKINENNGKGLIILSELEGAGDALVNTNHCMCAVNALLNAVPDNCEIGIHTDKQLWLYVPDEDCNAEELLSSLKKAVEECTVYDLDGNVINSGSTMTVTSGYTFSGTIAAHKMFCASFAFFEAKSAGRGTIREFSRENYIKSKEEYGKVNIFSQLIDLNLFKYHFQPIVSAGTGEIVAYEALMRTDASIGLNPLQILELAEKQDRLYDIERLTFSNVISSIKDNPDIFESRKLFFNAISSHILTDEDFQNIIKDNQDAVKKLVIELTEQTEISDSSLSVVHERISSQKMQLAIDDYGSGYSNTSNLIRYDPVYVKIDRSLISGIDSDTRKQNIVQSTIESLHANGYIALAEGVETSGELRTLIHMGVDLIQGFYLARPTQAIISEIPKSLRQE
ncbi:MAG: EAL domain-containing protein, partial [Huintestinicola sp.]